MKEIEIDCPCCEVRILIDVRTQTVLRHTPKAELDASGRPGTGTGMSTAAWDRAQAKVTSRKGRGTDAFEEALHREKSRPVEFDDLFEQAKAKVQKRHGELGTEAAGGEDPTSQGAVGEDASRNASGDADE